MDCCTSVDRIIVLQGTRTLSKSNLISADKTTRRISISTIHERFYNITMAKQDCCATKISVEFHESTPSSINQYNVMYTLAEGGIEEFTDVFSGAAPSLRLQL